MKTDERTMILMAKSFQKGMQYGVEIMSSSEIVTTEEMENYAAEKIKEILKGE